MLVWGLVACSWQKEKEELKVVQGKVGDSSGNTEKKTSQCSSSDSSPPQGEARVKSARAKRAPKGMQ